jgi:sugar phosphate isomerase/epimerase
LHQHYITGIEVAPCIVWGNWENATVQRAILYRKQLEDKGFSIPALQAIMYNTSISSIFDSTEQPKLLNHLSHVAELAEALGAKTVIFGAPKLRQTDKSFDIAIEETLSLFKNIAKIYHDHNAIFCVEPCGMNYGSNFVTSVKEAQELIKIIDSPGFGLHVDSGALYQANEQISDVNIDKLSHYHISEPDLKDFNNMIVTHDYNLQYLKDNNYTNWCSVEMRNSEIPFNSRGPWTLIDKYMIIIKELSW